MATYLRRRQFRLAAAVAAILAVSLLGWRLYNPPALYRVTILPSLGGAYVAAHALNDRGQVVGMEPSVSRPGRVFLWDRENGIRDLGFEAGGWRPLTINNAGQISGTTGPGGEAFLWEPGRGRIMLGTPDGTSSVAYTINNRGQIIGTSTAFGTPCGFLWDKARGMTRLTTPDGYLCWPVSINDAGQVLVESPLRSGHWFLLDPDGPKSLDMIPPKTWLRSINGNACMAAIDESNPSKQHLLLWDEQGNVKRLTPITELHALTRLNNRNQIAYTEVCRSSPWNRLPSWFPHSRSPYASHLWDPVRGRIPLDRHLRGMRDFQVMDLNNNACIVGIAEMKDGTTRSVLLEPIPERWGE